MVERCHVLTESAHSHGMAPYPYVPFGDPAAGLDDPTPTSYAVEEAAGDESTLALTDVDTHVVDISLPPEACPTSADHCYVRNRTVDAIEDTLYYSAFPDGDGWRLLLYTGSRIEADRVELEVDVTGFRHEDRERAFASLDNVWRQTDLGILGGKSVERAVNFYHQLRSLPGKTYDERYDADAHLRLSDPIDEPFGNLNALREDLCDVMADGKRLWRHHHGRDVDGDVFPADLTCDHCGRDLFIRQLSDGDGTRRAQGTCPRCSFVFNVPTEPGDRAPYHPRITGELMDGDGPYRDVNVTFTNHADVEAAGCVVPAIADIGDAVDGDPIFDPAMVEFDLRPGEQVVAEFAVDTTMLADNLHYVIGSVEANLEMYSVIGPLSVGGQRINVPPWHR